MRSACILAAAFALSWSVPAATVAYEHKPEGLSNFISHHAIGGPVLADDFEPAVGASGWVTFVEWWGSAATSDQWELTFHQGAIGTGGLGEPLPVPPLTGGTKVFVNATGTPLGGGLFYFSVVLPVGTFHVTEPRPLGSEYWFSTANADAGWTWALAGAGPTVGDEHWSAVQSFGSTPCGDGGPHCGAWASLSGNDLAFRLSTVPEPSSLVLLGAGLVLIGGLNRARRA